MQISVDDGNGAKVFFQAFILTTTIMGISGQIHTCRDG